MVLPSPLTLSIYYNLFHIQSKNLLAASIRVCLIERVCGGICPAVMTGAVSIAFRWRG